MKKLFNVVLASLFLTSIFFVPQGYSQNTLCEYDAIRLVDKYGHSVTYCPVPVSANAICYIPCPGGGIE